MDTIQITPDSISQNPPNSGCQSMDIESHTPVPNHMLLLYKQTLNIHSVSDAPCQCSMPQHLAHQACCLVIDILLLTIATFFVFQLWALFHSLVCQSLTLPVFSAHSLRFWICMPELFVKGTGPHLHPSLLFKSTLVRKKTSSLCSQQMYKQGPSSPQGIAQL